MSSEGEVGLLASGHRQADASPKATQIRSLVAA